MGDAAMEIEGYVLAFESQEYVVRKDRHVGGVAPFPALTGARRHASRVAHSVRAESADSAALRSNAALPRGSAQTLAM